MQLMVSVKWIAVVVKIYYERIRFLFMDYNIIEGSPKYIILESVYSKVPYEVFDAILKVDNINSVRDLKPILSKDDYESVMMCVRLRFCVQAIINYTEFLNVVGSDPDMLRDGLIFD